MSQLTIQELGLCSGELDDLLAEDSGLTDWELTFIEDLRLVRAAKGLDWRPSEGQRQKLHEIWDRVCS